MAQQSFGFGQQRSLRPERSGLPCAVYSCTVMSLTKSFTLKPPRTRAMPPVGKRVIRAGDVVAHGLRGPAANKNRARILNPLEIARRIDGEVFGRKTIGDVARLVDDLATNHKAVALESLARDGIVAAAQLCFGDDRFAPDLRAL